MTSTRDLGQRFGRFLASGKPIPALLGRVNSDDSVTIRVEDTTSSNRVYVRFYGLESETHEVINTRVKNVAHLPVLVELLNGKYRIIGTDDDEGEEFAGNLLPAFNTPDLPPVNTNQLIPGRNLLPGRVRLSEAGGLYLWVEAFHHAGGYWPGGDVDFTADMPSSSKKVWAVLSIDEGTNTPLITPQTEVDIAFDLLEGDLYDVPLISGQAVCAGVELIDGVTVFDGTTRIVDMGWWRSSGGSGGADLEGGVVINDDGGDYDLRVETSGNANMLFVDGGVNNVGIGTAAPDASAILDIVSTTKGLGLPTMTEAQRDAIASPRDGLMIFNSDTGNVDKYSAGWSTVGSGSGGATPEVSTDTFLTASVLHNETLGSNGAFDVSSISGSYDFLVLKLFLRGSDTATSDNVYIFFNNDTTLTNYRYQRVSGASTSAAAATGDIPFIGVASAAASPSNYFGIFEVIIPAYAGSTEKILQSVASDRLDASNSITGVWTVSWESTSAINRIMVRTDNHATDLFVAGSRLQILGYKTTSLVTAVSGGQTVASVTTTDNTPTVVKASVVAEDTAVVIRDMVIAIKDDGSEAVGGSVEGIFRRDAGGNVTAVGSLTTNLQDDSSGSPTFTLTANTGDQSVDCVVTGENSKTINWNCYRTIIPVSA